MSPGYLAHTLGLAPLAVMLLWGRRLPLAYWLVAVGLGLSWVGDSLGGTWGVTYWWLPGQILCVWLAFCRSVEESGRAVIGTGMISAVAHAGAGAGPDVVLTLVGSWAILLHASGPLAPVAIVYFGVGTVAYMLMAHHAGSWSIVPYWWAYQACRLAGVATFARVAIRRAP